MAVVVVVHRPITFVNNDVPRVARLAIPKKVINTLSESRESAADRHSTEWL